jgi:transposase
MGVSSSCLGDGPIPCGALKCRLVQQARIDQRWKEIDREAKAIIKCKKQGTKYKPIFLTNGDTPKQLLARSRYILCKMPHQWTKSQMHRAYLLFQLYPSIEQAYRFNRDFKNIYKLKNLQKAKAALVEWIKRAQDSSIEYFQSVAESLIAHWERIVAFFTTRSTNAHAESLNAQIKLFRSNLRGVTDTKFFLFRLEKIFA